MTRRNRARICAAAVAIAACISGTAFRAAAVDAGTLTVRVRNGAAPIARADVRAAGVETTTDREGTAVLDLPAGEHEIEVSASGFLPRRLRVAVQTGRDSVLVVPLRSIEVPDEVVTVRATRSDTVVGDQPVRVETVPQEEVEENLTAAPGTISTLLAELAGVQVRTASPSLGGSSLRLRGLPAGSVLILSDELPLFGDRPDAFGLLQVPPLDLAHVEVVKGPASALYGGTALAGVIDLVSRRPPGDPEVLLAGGPHGKGDAVGFFPFPLGSGWGGTVTGSADREDRTDLDGDGWADVAGVRRAVLRPRFFWSDDRGRSLFVTAGGTTERREGGGVTPLGAEFAERRDTLRTDAGIVGRFPAGRDRVLVVRGAVNRAAHDLTFGADAQHDRSLYALAEAALGATAGRHTWLVGAAVERDVYRVDGATGFDHGWTVPALFAQDELRLSDRVSLSAGARGDFHEEFGTLLGTNVAALARAAHGWSVRLSAGSGQAAPTPRTDETDVVGLGRVLPFRGARETTVRGASLDVEWSGGPFEWNGAVFASTIDDPLLLRPGSDGTLSFINAATPTRIRGAESIARYQRGPWQAIASATVLRAVGEDRDAAVRGDVPLTPRATGELAAIWEDEERGRAGIEVSFTGRQRLEDDPYRDRAPGFVEVNFLAELRVHGESGVFLDVLDLTDVRQTDWDPLLRPEPGPDGRWTTDAWAPIRGRTVIAGLHWEF